MNFFFDLTCLDKYQKDNLLESVKFRYTLVQSDSMNYKTGSYDSL